MSRAARIVQARTELSILEAEVSAARRMILAFESRDNWGDGYIAMSETLDRICRSRDAVALRLNEFELESARAFRRALDGALDDGRCCEVCGLVNVRAPVQPCADCFAGGSK